LRRKISANSPSATVVQADDRAADLQGQIHHLADLLAVHLAETAAVDGEVLAVDAHRAAVHGAEPGDDAVAVRPVLLHAEAGAAVPGQLVEFLERAGVEQQLDPFARGQLALGVLLLDGARGSGVLGLVQVFT
jgi:hypothetical protein